MLRVMHELVQAGGQIVLATHSPILMAYPDATIYHLDDQGIEERALEDVTHFVMLKAFLGNPTRMVREILQD